MLPEVVTIESGRKSLSGRRQLLIDTRVYGQCRAKHLPSVYPSGVALAIASAPMLRPHPADFDHDRLLKVIDILSAMARVTMSVVHRHFRVDDLDQRFG